jgi:hypothetical protein
LFKEKKVLGGTYNNQNSILSLNTIWKNKFNRMSKRYIRVALLGKGEILGIEELVNKSSKRFFQALVTTKNATLISIPTMVRNFILFFIVEIPGKCSKCIQIHIESLKIE